MKIPFFLCLQKIDRLEWLSNSNWTNRQRDLNYHVCLFLLFIRIPYAKHKNICGCHDRNERSPYQAKYARCTYIRTFEFEFQREWNDLCFIKLHHFLWCIVFAIVEFQNGTQNRNETYWKEKKNNIKWKWIVEKERRRREQTFRQFSQKFHFMVFLLIGDSRYVRHVRLCICVWRLFIRSFFLFFSSFRDKNEKRLRTFYSYIEIIFTESSAKRPTVHVTAL